MALMAHQAVYLHKPVAWTHECRDGARHAAVLRFGPEHRLVPDAAQSDSPCPLCTAIQVFITNLLAIKQMRESPVLQQTLRAVLAVGNYLNYGGRLGAAVGFRYTLSWGAGSTFRSHAGSCLCMLLKSGTCLQYGA